MKQVVHSKMCQEVFVHVWRLHRNLFTDMACTLVAINSLHYTWSASAIIEGPHPIVHIALTTNKSNKKILGYITYSTLYFILFFYRFWTYVRVLLLLLVLQSMDWLTSIIVLFAKCVTNFKHLTTPFACCQTLPPLSTTPLRHQYLTWHCQIYKKKWC